MEFQDNGNNEYSETKLKIANLFYVVVFIVVGILGFVMYNTGDKWIGKIINTDHKMKHEIGLSSVLRTTTPLALWYLIHALICLCNRDLDESSWQFRFHSKFLFVHLFGFFALFAGFIFIPDSFYDVWVKICYFISGIYLILQIIFLVEFFHEINQKFVDQEKMWPIITLTLICGIGSLVAFGVSFYVFVKDGCSNNNIIISINMILCIILLLGSAFIEHASIFTGSLISAYVAYLTIAGMMCQPKCNRLSDGKQGIAFSVIASVFTLIWAGYSAFSTSNQFASCDCVTEDEEARTFSLSFFHTLFAFASVYISMIVTNWGKLESTTSWTTDRGKIPRWVNFAASWVVILLYGWTLIAPIILKDREFDF